MPRAYFPYDILQFFQKNNGQFTSRDGIYFQMISQELFTVTWFLKLPPDSNFQPPMKIQLNHYGLLSFIADYQITSVHYLKNKITPLHLYDLYYDYGKGKIIYSLNSLLEIPQVQSVNIIFEHSPDQFMGTTKIYIPYLHFFEELEEGFYDEEEYMDYIKENKQAFAWLQQNRHLIKISQNLGKAINNN